MHACLQLIERPQSGWLVTDLLHNEGLERLRNGFRGNGQQAVQQFLADVTPLDAAVVAGGGSVLIQHLCRTRPAGAAAAVAQCA